MLLFLRGSAHYAFLRVGPRAPRAPLLTPSPNARRAAVGRAAVGAPPAGRNQAPRPPPRHVASPLLDPPLSVVPATPFKWEPPPTDRFPPSHRSSRPSTPERRTLSPHLPGVRHAGSRHRGASSMSDSVRVSPSSAPFR
jgi:hypothetical protein